MTRFIIRRFIFLILAIFAATLIVFALSRLQGDPRNVMLNVGYVSPEQWEAWGKDFHLDKPVVIQFDLDWQRDFPGRFWNFSENWTASAGNG